jgi:sugar transferase EpsL
MKPTRRPSWYRRRGKRLLDLALTVPGVAALAPVMIGTAVAVRAVHGSPVLFTQQRPGHKGETFKILKFRTMTNERGPDGHLLPNEERVTRLGKLLRQTSLDELPELLNVLKGDMSLVGPRPLLIQYLEHYSPEQARRHDVKPGLTGWAQINGRNVISWEQKFRHDVWYVDHLSPLLDLRIIASTVAKVLARDSVNEEGLEGASYFAGSRTEDIE